MSERQQMRRSEAGARSLLRVRTAVIDGELERLNQVPIRGAANEPVAVPLTA